MSLISILCLYQEDCEQKINTQREALALSSLTTVTLVTGHVGCGTLEATVVVITRDVGSYLGNEASKAQRAPILICVVLLSYILTATWKTKE